MANVQQVGRPRDTTIDEKALAAARALLVERGFDATTVQAIAERAGVHSSALYRRWPSRIELIEDAAFPAARPVDIAPTGDLRRDLRRFVRAYLAAFGEPAARVAAPGLLAHRRSSDKPEVYLRVSARPQFHAILAAAPPESVDPSVDPDDVFDMLLGAIWTRVVLVAVTTRNRPLERTIDMVLRMVRPYPPRG
ncbi:TetR/AcrR family transcriptional regulator [Nocardia bovistercoris]|uniref:TetR/AcrR family transcriptional regulator n=1 Tax=Nocardia bovistercoris TaxID=2785916 RepID=A0A931IEW6_9NOCA|nr:TetR/AcrR family transcriptional regulator [Nocardia bovistercoris]MBH0778443.1 TetR/AcrR family transcriptional regulator [Nocardia bovistercoris]